MSRAEVIAQLGQMRAMYPLLQYAHCDCESISDHDLRSMLEDATRLTEDKGESHRCAASSVRASQAARAEVLWECGVDEPPRSIRSSSSVGAGSK